MPCVVVGSRAASTTGARSKTCVCAIRISLATPVTVTLRRRTLLATTNGSNGSRYGIASYELAEQRAQFTTPNGHAGRYGSVTVTQSSMNATGFGGMKDLRGITPGAWSADFNRLDLI